MFLLLPALVGCNEPLPTDLSVRDDQVELPSLLVLNLPPSLSAENALALAQLEASLSDLPNLVVEIDGQRSPAHRLAPTQAFARGVLSEEEDTLHIELCVESSCQSHSGATLVDDLAAQLQLQLPPEGIWALPEEPSLHWAKTSALVAYGFSTVKKHRIGGRWDPVARAPREVGATALVSYLQGRRDLRIGRNRHGAEAYDHAAKVRDTPRSQMDAAMAYLDAGWVDVAFERSRAADSDDLRLLGGRVAIAHERGRPDIANAALDRLPPHPSTAALRFLLKPNRDSLRIWRERHPDDPALRWAEVEVALDQHGLPELLLSHPELKEELPLLNHLYALEKHLHGAKTDALRASRVQNAYASIRKKGPLPCDDPAREPIEEAHRLGSRHREQVELARRNWKALQPMLSDPLRIDHLGGPGLTARIQQADETLQEQLRAAKVLRSYQERVLLDRVCPSNRRL